MRSGVRNVYYGPDPTLNCRGTTVDRSKGNVVQNYIDLKQERSYGYDQESKTKNIDQMERSLAIREITEYCLEISVGSTNRYFQAAISYHTHLCNVLCPTGTYYGSLTWYIYFHPICDILSRLLSIQKLGATRIVAGSTRAKVIVSCICTNPISIFRISFRYCRVTPYAIKFSFMIRWDRHFAKLIRDSISIVDSYREFTNRWY